MTLDDVDIYNPDNYVRSVPYAQFDFLRQHAPVYWHRHPHGGGFWVLTRHRDVVAVSRDHQRFSAEERFVLVDDLPEDVLEMASNYWAWIRRHMGRCAGWSSRALVKNCWLSWSRRFGR